MTDFHLDGIDGGNPLGFLAALGTLATASSCLPGDSPRLTWSSRKGAWRPLLALRTLRTREDLLDALHRDLSAAEDRRAFSIADNLSLACEAFRQNALQARDQADANNRSDADFISAFGSDAVEATSNGKPNGKIADTAFRTMSGAGHQHFLGTMRTLARDTTIAHLAKALFQEWRYDDPLEKHTMRWDPHDDVRRALRWHNPSGDPERRRNGSMWGANRLAIEALTLLPTAPVRDRLRTTGFREIPRQGARWTWPIWTTPLGLDSVRSLLALSELQEEPPDRERLLMRGIAEIYRTRRITQDKYRNLVVAHPA